MIETPLPDFSQSPWQPHIEAALQAAEEAGRRQMEALGKEHEVAFKGRTEPVTEVDKNCESAIVDFIRKRFPSHDFLLEETKMERTGSPYLWIVDPLDGTSNYVRGFPHFCCSIALEVEGEAVLGVAWDPIRKELFSAVRSHGAFLNGAPIRVSSEGRLMRSMLATGFPSNMLTAEDTNLEKFCRTTPQVQTIRRSGSSVLDLAYVAAGRLDGFWVVRIAPWDMAAGALLVEEAGGRVTDLTGMPYEHEAGKLLATNGRIHETLLRVFHDSP